MQDRLFRALVWLRVVLIVNAVTLNIYRYDNFHHPYLGTGIVAVMVVWTVFATWAYAAPSRRVPALLCADLLITLAALISSPLVKGETFNASVPGFWVAAALIAWAIHWQFVGGLVAAALVSACDLLIRDGVSQTNYGNVFLLMIAAPIVGYLCGSLQRMAAERAAAEHAAAVEQERARLARAVHDGVLQVLALVQRKGAEIGGEGAELGRLAGDQEQALRSLIRQQDALVEETVAAETDLVAELEKLGTRRPPRVQVATPGEAIRLPAHVTSELTDAVKACLDNVARHVGEEAPAWVLLEDMGGSVIVTVRDEGPGIPEGRLDSASSEGRLGVSASIKGRLEDLGGRADLFTAPDQGVEWELSVPSGRPLASGP
ncbi:MAG: DUF5931 domain-containing protein [Nocardioides sp.]|nr:DUF5931 domain-containing protein [Nocardioides sp.]